jgi:NDP-4-keto-2,6-dideoxyhexose 3-C-methyltransferase
LLDFLRTAKAQGKQVVGLGASTKGNVLLQYCGITPDLMAFVGEVNPDKYGSFTPGTFIPIVAEKALLEKKPDYLMVLPWHFRAFFETAPAFRGLTLVFPLPQLDIVPIPA